METYRSTTIMIYMFHLSKTTVSEEEKVPLNDADIKQHVHNVSKTHYNKIKSISSSKGKPNRHQEGKDIDTILDENETDLFNISQMIKEWLDKQECSHYEKRIKLRKAVKQAKDASPYGKACEEEDEQK